eukprot:COSAG05_NODE_23315_length_259_cov_0.525000_1_plen_45_part_10
MYNLHFTLCRIAPAGYKVHVDDVDVDLPAPSNGRSIGTKVFDTIM